MRRVASGGLTVSFYIRSALCRSVGRWKKDGDLGRGGGTRGAIA